MPLTDRPPAFQREADSGRDCWPGCQGDFGPVPSIPPWPISWRPGRPQSYRRSANSPVEPFGALRNGSLHSADDRLPHAGDGKKVERFLNRTPILLGDKYGVMALSCNEHRPARSGGFIQQAIEPGPRLAGGESVHTLSVYRTIWRTPPRANWRPRRRARSFRIFRHGVATETVSRELQQAGLNPISSKTPIHRWLMVVMVKPAPQQHPD